MKVLSLTPSDLEACIHLDQLALKGLWNKQQWQRELKDDRRLCEGIKLTPFKLIALACGWLVADELHLTLVAVHPDHRQQGLAKIVLSALLKKAHQLGANDATLEVDSSNLAAIALYKGCGFITAGCRTNYYRNGNDAIIQWCSLRDRF